MEAEIAEIKVAELSSNHDNVRDMVSVGFEYIFKSLLYFSFFFFLVSD